KTGNAEKSRNALEIGGFLRGKTLIGGERDQNKAREILHSLGGRGRVQIHNYSYRIRGLARLADYVIRWEAMVSEKAKHKARVLSFCAFFELPREL
ncbi:MAG: hypothetical protein ACE5I0_07630, partial [Candidatus Binatia bacterium]